MRPTRWMPFLLLVAFLLPVGARFFWYYRGFYRTPEISEIDASQIAPSLIEHKAFQDHPAQAEGRVVFDLSKINNLDVDDLAPLRDRLAARGTELATYDGLNLPLQTALTGATALVVAAPSIGYAPEEVEAVRLFVKDGGRLLLIADPTRPVPPYDEFDLFSVIYATSATPAINSLANEFGIIYNTDYLYNLIDNAGNYRNVRLLPADTGPELLEGVEQVIFFAAHSVRSEGEALLVGDDQTQSNLRLGEQALSPAVLSEQGSVLALGDLTFLTAPYHTQADNDQLLSNLADWLAQDSREWSLEDFPYLFQQPVDIVQTFAEVLEPELIAAVGPLQSVFTSAGMEAGLRQEATEGRDALYLSTFSEVDPVKDALDAAGVSIVPPPELDEGAEETTDGEETDTQKGEIRVEGFGDFEALGSSLFMVEQAEARTTMVVIAEDASALSLALQRLAANDFSGCAAYEKLMVCSNTGDTSFGPGDEEEPTGGEEPVGSVFILSADTGQGIGNSTFDMEAILTEAGYNVTTWSQYVSGLPDSTVFSGYDVYILDAGDYAWDTNLADAVALMFSADGAVFITGEQLNETGESGSLMDLEVVNENHPIAMGTSQGEVIPLSESNSGVPTSVLETTDDATVVFARGPISEQAGAPALVSIEQFGYRYVIASFAFYRLPAETLRNLLLNTISWLTFAT